MFKKWILVLIGICLWGHPAGADPLAGRDGCFLLVRVSDGRVIAQWNEARIERRFSPCSTFKVAVAAMAFDQKILDSQRIFVWDGQDSGREACNCNQTARSWIVNSVVWVTQRLTVEMGLARVQEYLQKFHYGNQDVSGGIRQSWLTSSLSISAREQVRFLRDLWLSKLPIAPQAQNQTRALLLVEERGPDRLDGKTGSGWLGEKRQLGWFVGHLRHADVDYVFAMNYSDRKAGETKSYAGFTARTLVVKELERLKLLSRGVR